MKVDILPFLKNGIDVPGMGGYHYFFPVYFLMTPWTETLEYKQKTPDIQSRNTYPNRGKAIRSQRDSRCSVSGGIAPDADDPVIGRFEIIIVHFVEYFFI